MEIVQKKLVQMNFFSLGEVFRMDFPPRVCLLKSLWRP